MKISHIVKRLIDIIVSTILMLLLTPFVLITMCLIFCCSGTPLFYRSSRFASVDGCIKVWKFRTMVKDAKSPKYGLNERFMRDGYLDIPVSCEVYTPIGRFLEMTQFVEVPQLWNIIVDKMSFIGNRPLPRENINILKKFSGWERRFDSPAGLTGISQVVGKFCLKPQQRLELEKTYSEVYLRGNILKADFMIVIYTIKLLIFKENTPLVKAKKMLSDCLFNQEICRTNMDLSPRKCTMQSRASHQQELYSSSSDVRDGR